MPEPRRVFLEICCNDPDNGLFVGRAAAIEIGNRISFECRYIDWSPKLTEGDGFIRIGGRKLQCFQSREWYGNWCWNVYLCRSDEVEALVNWPKFRKWFDISEAHPRVFDAYKAGKPLRWKRRVPTPTEPPRPEVPR